jgi:hypothetical protein
MNRNKALTVENCTKPQADTSALEREIDQRVYQLYGLSDDEVRIVEGN